MDTTPQTTPRRRPGGRTSLLTEHVQRTICAAIESGMFFDPACVLAGVAPDTGREWMARGENRSAKRKPKPVYIAFAAKVREAEAMLEYLLTKDVITFARADHSAKDTLKILERRFPQRWSEAAAGAPTNGVTKERIISEVIVMLPGAQPQHLEAPRHALPAAQEVDLAADAVVIHPKDELTEIDL